MWPPQQDVKEFMINASQIIPNRPIMPDEDTKSLRIKLIQEELDELKVAFLEDNLEESCDAIIDILVVTIGAAIALGVNIEPLWNEIHRSNMAKFGPGGYKREDGKWIKPPDWKKHDLKPLLAEQITTGIKYAP